MHKQNKTLNLCMPILEYKLNKMNLTIKPFKKLFPNWCISLLFS